VAARDIGNAASGRRHQALWETVTENEFAAGHALDVEVRAVCVRHPDRAVWLRWRAATQRPGPMLERLGELGPLLRADVE
jgi:hypothetical protein